MLQQVVGGDHMTWRCAACKLNDTTRNLVFILPIDKEIKQ